MTQPMPNKCPLCSGSLEVTEASCLDCQVQMRGHFTLAPYRNLDAEQIKFLETFLRCRGVIRDMEAALGISSAPGWMPCCPRSALRTVRMPSRRLPPHR